MVHIEIILFRNHMSLEEQHRWWLEDHSPVVRRIPGLRGYTINLADRGDDDDEPGICGTNTLSFDDWDAAMVAYKSIEWIEARAQTQASGTKVLRTRIKRQVTIV